MRFLQRVFAVSILAACLLFVLGPAPTFAAGTKKTKLTAPPDMRKMIKSVDVPNSTITISYAYGKQVHVYKIDAFTSVQVDGSSAKVSDIKAGMEVAEYTERDSDDLDSVSLLSKTSAPTIADASPAAVSGSTKTIQAVLADKRAIVIYYAETKQQHTYRIDGNTALTVNGVAGAFGDIKTGMTVKDYMERDNDDLDSLTVTGY
jgi:predicted Zn-dependent protease